MRDIDDMDILFYFRLMHRTGKKQKKVVPIDQVGFL